MESHNELRDGVSELASKAFAPMHARDNTKIYTGLSVNVGKDNLKGPP